jgi:hypothetical protein
MARGGAGQCVGGKGRDSNVTRKGRMAACFSTNNSLADQALPYDSPPLTPPALAPFLPLPSLFSCLPLEVTLKDSAHQRC